MKPEPAFFFPPFHLDLVNAQLWRGPQLLPLRPKTFAVLCCLVEHASVLVTKEELLKAVWPATHGAEGLPKKSIHELRKVLGDDAATPRFIETVARRGWRFIAPLATAPRQSLESRVQRLASKNSSPPLSDVQTLDPRRQTLDGPLVGREAELAQLHGWLERALGGERQVVFVTGEPGIGKTAVVDAFLQSLESKGQGLESRVPSLEPRVRTLKQILPCERMFLPTATPTGMRRIRPV